VLELVETCLHCVLELVETCLHSSFFHCRPQADETSDRFVKKTRTNQELTHARAVQEARAAVPPRAVPPAPIMLADPIPPTPRFNLKSKMFYIIEDHRRTMEDAAKAIWGHYIVPTQTQGGRAAPLPSPIQFAHPAHVYRGAPGIPLDPTTIPDIRPRPDPHYCIENKDYVCAIPWNTSPYTGYYEIGMQNLKQLVQQAEETDLEFARKIQVFLVVFLGLDCRSRRAFTGLLKRQTFSDMGLPRPRL
jgi:hypothetical protein